MPDRAERPLRLLTAAFVLIALLTNGCTNTSTNTESAFGQECVRFHPDPENPFFEPDRTWVDQSVLEWPSARPSDVGIDPVALEVAADEVALSSVAASLLVARNGKLVFERYFNGLEAGDARNLQSLTKSITSVMTGIAIEEGLLELDSRIGDILPPDLVVGHGDLTVSDLVTMSGGLEVPDPDGNYEWEPSDVPGEPSLIKAVLSSKGVAEPGTEFSYNTGLTDVLAAVVAEAADMPFCEYAADRLLGPIGIDVENWHVEPGGYFSGGSAMFITPREIARFGQVVLDGGRFDGEQFIPADWLQQSLSTRWDLGCGRNPNRMIRYGYLWWGSEIGGHDVWVASGSGGQELAIIEDLDLLVVITHDSGTEGQRVSMSALLYELVLGAVEGEPQPEEDASCPSPPGIMATIPADGSRPRSTLPDWPAGIFGTTSPDGRRLAFSGDYLGYSDLYTINLDGTDQRRVNHDAIPDGMPAWSPDGDLLAFARGGVSQSDLFLITPNGTGLEQLTDLEGYEQGPTWSPDGRRIAFVWGHQDVRSWGHPGELWVIDRDGSNLRQLREESTTNPVWSPDGHQILFDSITAAGHIGVLDLTTGTETDLGEGFFPRWSPDGGRIVYAAFDDNGGSDIYTMAADGSDRIRLTSDPDFDTVPQWSQDGATIIYWTNALSPETSQGPGQQVADQGFQ
jgi:Tol biopolymer transport system component/CubicO group peptidase (beta-lactamase class C family)